jgi:hypothetical protein
MMVSKDILMLILRSADDVRDSPSFMPSNTWTLIQITDDMEKLAQCHVKKRAKAFFGLKVLRSEAIFC